MPILLSSNLPVFYLSSLTLTVWSEILPINAVIFYNRLNFYLNNDSTLHSYTDKKISILKYILKKWSPTLLLEIYLDLSCSHNGAHLTI